MCISLVDRGMTASVIVLKRVDQIPKRYSSSNPSGRCWPHFLCFGHPSMWRCQAVPFRPACPMLAFQMHLSRWRSGCCFDCILQPPTSDTDPSNADKLVHMYRRGGNGRLGREERDKGSDSCRRRGRNVDSDADVRRGRRISDR